MPKKRKDGRYQANIFIGKNPDGERIFKTVYGKTLSELETNKSNIVSSLTKGTYADDKGHTVNSYALKWLASYKKGIVSNSTYNGYSNIIKNHINPIANIELMKLTKSDIQNAINKLSGHYDLQRRIKITLSQILECAIEDGLVYKNVCRNVSLPSKPKSSKRALNSIEIKAIERVNLSLKQKAFISILLNTGMRRGEVLALTKGDIDLERDLIHVTKSLEFNENTSAVKSTKTESGERTIDIIGDLKPVLTLYLSQINTLYLFTMNNGSTMSKTSYRRFWKGIYIKINTAAGGKHHYEKSKVIYDIEAIKGLTPHIFRHNYATMLYYAGVDIKDAQRLLGHADSKTTIDIYTHLNKQVSNTKNKLNNYMSKMS